MLSTAIRDNEVDRPARVSLPGPHGQKMTFGRMPKPWSSFNLETGELVTAERIDIGKPSPGKVVTPVDVWITLKPKD